MEQNSDNPITDGGQVAQTSYGKFSGPEELLKAYNALESEFTRRSQKLKEYEKTYGESSKSIEEQKAYFSEKFGLNSEVLNEAARRAETETDKRLDIPLIGVLSERLLTPEQMASDSEVVDRVLSESKNREAIINSYIERIKKVDAPVVFPDGGASPALAALKPTTVKEAGDIARAIFARLSYK